MSTCPSGEAARLGPPIRIRYILLLVVMVGVVAYTMPRARAAWSLHSAATSFADYAQCMIGPTGPTLLRDDPTRFWRLVRQRLIGAPAASRPFERCAKAVFELTGAAPVSRAHRARAWDFVEYGGEATDRARRGEGRQLTIADLRVTRQRLADLAKAAQPFVRGGYARLVKPSSHAYEAPHPVPLPKPAVGSGLPSWPARYRVVKPSGGGHLLAVGRGANLSAFRTTDGGVTWAPASVQTEELHRVAGRCPAGKDGASFEFDLTADGEELTLRSIRSDDSARSVPLASATTQVIGASCDEDTLVALLAPEEASEAELWRCVFGGACERMAVPGFLDDQAESLRRPADVARLDGVTIVAVTMHGIVRVASSRDDGATWTPWTVAHDAALLGGAATHVESPGRLLVMGSDLLLYGGASRPQTTYPVLVSHDQGASFRRPGGPARLALSAQGDARQ